MFSEKPEKIEIKKKHLVLIFLTLAFILAIYMMYNLHLFDKLHGGWDTILSGWVVQISFISTLCLVSYIYKKDIAKMNILIILFLTVVSGIGVISKIKQQKASLLSIIIFLIVSVIFFLIYLKTSLYLANKGKKENRENLKGEKIEIPRD